MLNYPNMVSEPWLCEACQDDSKQSKVLPSKNMSFKTRGNAKVKFISAEEVASLALGSKPLPVYRSKKENVGSSVSRIKKENVASSVSRAGHVLKKLSHTSESTFPRAIATTELLGYSGKEKKKSPLGSVPPGFQSPGVADVATDPALKSLSESFMTEKSEDVSSSLQLISLKSECDETDSKSGLQISSLHLNNEQLTTSDEPLVVYPDIQCMESDRQGTSLSSALLMVRNENEIQWRGRFVIKDVVNLNIHEDIRAHFPEKISMKAYSAAKEMPETLQLRLVNRLDIWPRIFQLDHPSCDDVAICFLPSEHDRLKEKFIHLWERMIKNDLALCCCLDDLELLIYTSKLLLLDSEKVNTNPHLWGIFRHLRRKNVKQQTGKPKDGNCAEVDMEIGLVGGNDIGKVDKPVAMPLSLRMSQLNDCGPASDQNSLNINKSPSSLVKAIHEEQNVPDVPPGFCELNVGDSGCKKRLLVKSLLKKPISHIISDILPGFSRPDLGQAYYRLPEDTGKSPIPEKNDIGDPVVFASSCECMMSSSGTEKVSLVNNGSSSKQVTLVRNGRSPKGQREVPGQADPVVKSVSPVSPGHGRPKSPFQTSFALSLFSGPGGRVGRAVEPGGNPASPVSPDLSLSRPHYVSDGKRWIPEASRERLKKDDCGKDVHLSL